MTESEEKQTITCNLFLDNDETSFYGVKCGHGDARYCLHVNNTSITCIIKEAILKMRCCSFCGYHERFIVRFKNNNIHVFLCSNCKREMKKEEIITYEEYIQRKDLKKLRKSWFCGNNKTI
ncbi:hypothetical protein LCGC14_1079530 [marine sediment metagenome]|uniref:Uncharacterized protein n=1 Tax=marine sediment metagenome TaxID=412755 RepID=A0A0F9PYR9_9ZZZZ|nr:MAG: hypothetical protein Lokiarch_05770 [Candidatus Lokiarchaeum sp. GC14_75]